MDKLSKNITGILILSLLLVSLTSVNALVIDSVVIADEVEPGQTTRLSIGLENDGDEDVEEVSVSLDFSDVPFAPFDSSSEFGIDEIREDKTKFAEFRIIALNNAKSGIYKIPVTISFVEDDETKTKSSIISIVVDSKPIMDVSVDSNLLLKGKDNEITVRITNKGLSDATFVEAEIGSGSFNLLSPKKQYIGNVDSDDFDTINVNVFFKENAPDSINFPVTIIYKDDLNKEYREDFNLGLSVYDESRAVSLGLMERNNVPTYVTGILLIVILYFVYRRLRKRARNKNKLS